ncbi:MAG: DUF2797 domain-containing protein [Proteobacteria bacterium]|nr:MAG: DUF2797 domain-containing protein [Pseudomonadota bacterium]
MTPVKLKGNLEKMRTCDDSPVRYSLMISDAHVDISELVGQRIKLFFTGNIACVGCGRKVRKTFNQGYCFPCFRSLAACDRCITSPELCHYAAGTCREPEWASRHCMQPHVVYFANSSGIKVGITRASQIPTRFIDQGAIQAMPVVRVANRYHSGLVEVMLKRAFNDRTEWRTMLKNAVTPVDLDEVWREYRLTEGIDESSIADASGAASASLIANAPVYEFDYPVVCYPETVRAINVDKSPEIDERLLGIKGQYLIFERGVINIRKYGGYEIVFEA